MTLALIGQSVIGQTNAPAGTNSELTLSAFLGEVASANLSYAAQRYNVPIARAALDASKLFPNPVVSFNAGRDVSHSGSSRLPDTFGGSLTQTIELGGKRKARIPDRNLRAASATLEGYFENLRADATAAFVDALAAGKTLEQKRHTAESLTQLAEANKERLRVGDIGETDATQSQVEALQFQSEVLSAESDARAATIALAGFLGRNRAMDTIIPVGSLKLSEKKFDASALILEALGRRSDLIALRHSRDAAEAGIQVSKANRFPDVDIGGGLTHGTASQNPIAPSPSVNTVGLSLSFPLPLFNRRREEIETARLTRDQAEKTLQASEQKAEIEIRRNLARYELAAQRVHRFEAETLSGADKVLEAKRYSYQRGQTTLLELLDAQRTSNEVHQVYLDALAETAKALIEVERSAQLWDITL